MTRSGRFDTPAGARLGQNQRGGVPRDRALDISRPGLRGGAPLRAYLVSHPHNPAAFELPTLIEEVEREEQHLATSRRKHAAGYVSEPAS